MYIKKVIKRNKGSRKPYAYLHLVENVRTEKGPRQRLVLNLGRVNIPKEQYKDLANCVEGLLSGQKSLLSADPQIEKHAKKAVRQILDKRSKEEALQNALDVNSNENTSQLFQSVDVASIEAHESRCIGPEYVCHSIFKELKLDEVLLSSGTSAQGLALMETLVVGRLVDAGSERHTWFWAENRSAIYQLIARPLRCSLNSFYRAADALFKCKQALEVHLSKKEKQLFSLSERMCFLDLTNTYLEGQALRNPKAKRGHSKEKRSDCKLLTLALIIDEQGFAKYSHLYAGNQNDSKSLKEMIESLVTIRPDLSKQRTVILDAGVATEENVRYLQQNHFHYIVVNRSKGAFTVEDTDKMELIYSDDDQQFKVEVSRQHKAGEAWLLCRSTGRQQKERGIRRRQENLFIERLKYYRKGLDQKGHTKVYAKVIEMIGRLREKYPRASKRYEIMVIPDDDPVRRSTIARDIIWKKRTESAGKFDGCFVLRTDRFDMTAGQIWKTYLMLTRVEKAFRCLKSSLGLRPVFHQVQQRADAHMFISVLAYHILHIIEHRLRMHGDHRSWETIRDVLCTHQRLTIAYNVKEQDKMVRYHLRLCSTPEPEHRVIYHRLGLSALPLGRTYIAIK